MDSEQISRHPQSLALPCRRALRGRSQLQSCQEDAPTTIYPVISRLVEAGAREGLQQCSVSAVEHRQRAGRLTLTECIVPATLVTR
jgi:hypothetical protein